MSKLSRRGLLAAGGALLALALGVTTISLAPAASAATLFTDTFSDGDAAGWTASGGTWAVSSEGTYRQSGTSSDARSRAGVTSWTEYTVSARIRPIAVNGSNRFVALLARVQSATNYYYLALRSNNTIELKKLVGGSSTTLATASVSFATGSWYTVSLQVSGASLRGTVGTTTVTASDSQFSTGQVGVATFNASADFDDVVVDSTTTPGSSAPGSPSASSAGPSPSSPAPSSPAPSVPVPPVPGSGPIGFASLNALGQNGTTGGVGGATVTVTTTDALLTAIDTVGPLIIRVQGTINITSKQGVRPNKTIVGVGDNATINGGGFDFYKSYNVIVQNLTFTNADDDSINIGQNSHHIWIDHNTFLPAADGSVDIVRGADYVTVSWNHFSGTDKTMLIGHSDSNAAEDTGHLKITIHHNYFDGSVQRHPRVRFGEPVHVYNNYYRGVSLYAIAATMDAGVYVEANYFSSVAFPCYSASGYADSGPGRLVSVNNVFVSSGACETNGTVVNPHTYYNYTVDAPASLPSIIPAGAGAGHLGL